MPQSRTSSRTALSRLLFLAVLGWALVALGRRTSEETEGTFAAAELGGTPVGGLEPRPVSVRARGRTRRKRLATSLAFATLFFAGAALSAGAGDMLVGSMEPSAAEGDTTTTTETTADDPAAGEEAPAEDPTEAPAEEPTETEAPADDGTTPAEGGESTDPGETTDPGDGSEPGETTDPGDEPTEAPGDGDSSSDHGRPGRRRRRSARTEGPARRRSALPRGRRAHRQARSGGRHVRRRHRVAPPDAPGSDSARAATRAPLGEDAPHRVECRRLLVGPRPRRGSRERPHRPHSRLPGDRPVAGPPPRGNRRARRVELVPRAAPDARAGPTGPRRSPATTGPSASTRSWSGSTPRSARSSGRC